MYEVFKMHLVQYSFFILQNQSTRDGFILPNIFPLLHIYYLFLPKVKFCINYVCANYRLLHFDNCVLLHCVSQEDFFIV